MPDKKLYRIEEVGKMLSISRSRVYQLIDEGKLAKTKELPARISSASIRKYYLSIIPDIEEEE